MAPQYVYYQMFFVAFSFSILYFLLIFAVVCALERCSYGIPTFISTHETIVVFGAFVHSNGPCSELAARLDHAITIHVRRGSSIAVSGGFSGSTSETEVMYDYLVAHGVNHDKLFVLLPGHNTLATFKSIAEHSDDKHWVAVSSPYHSARLFYLAFTHRLALSPSCPVLKKSTHLYLLTQRMRESLAISCLVACDFISVLRRSFKLGTSDIFIKWP
jgi:vancomycin permeability regulator SanA